MWTECDKEREIVNVEQVHFNNGALDADILSLSSHINSHGRN